MYIIQDFNVSVPTNFSGSLNRPIPASPSSITVAQFGLGVNTTGSRVLLIGTTEFQSFLGNPQISLKIFRNATIIGTVNVGTLAVNETRNTTFQIVDNNPPIGHHGYTLTAEVTNGGILNQASIVGPVSLSGTTLVLSS